MTTTQQAVGAVIVSYHADPAALTALVENLAAQVGAVVVVDNTPAGAAVPQLPASAVWLANGANLGIAEAFNRGIQWLLERGFDYILLSDQDSVPEPDFVRELLSAHQALTRRQVKVGAVGATFVEGKSGQVAGFSVVAGGRVSMNTAPDATGYVPASFIISSGSLTHRTLFEDVGLMETGLFIDLVDVEWCYRAAHFGYKFYGAPAARMLHTIGDALVHYWVGRWKSMPRHSPFRVYFQYRNFMTLLARGYMPPTWKWWMVKSRLSQLYVILFFYKDQRFATLARCLKGVLHGLMGRKGALAE